MRKTYYPGDIVTVLNLSEHYHVPNYFFSPNHKIELASDDYTWYSMYQLKQEIQGQLYYVRHIDHKRQLVMLAFTADVNYSFMPEQIALYRRPLLNHLKALGAWLRHTFYFSKPVIKP